MLTLKRALETNKLELSKILPLYFCIHCGRCDEECQVNLKYSPSITWRISPSTSISDPGSHALCPEIEGSPEFSRFLEAIRQGLTRRSGAASDLSQVLRRLMMNAASIAAPA
jgi:ferredoxin